MVLLLIEICPLLMPFLSRHSADAILGVLFALGHLMFTTLQTLLLLHPMKHLISLRSKACTYQTLVLNV